LQAPDTKAAAEGSVVGGFYALGAFLIWGGVPIYFKAVAEVPSLEVLAHRIAWSVVLIALMLSVLRRWRAVKATLADRRLLATLLVSSLLVSINWLIFIWAVAQARVLETSLGYFINPLVSVVLGVLFLRERLKPWQWCAVLLALAGFALTWPLGAWRRRRTRLRAPFPEVPGVGAERIDEHPHVHGDDCGHPAVRHGNHVDYLHDGHRHAPHEEHYDEH